jgi:neutral ceramidase
MFEIGVGKSDITAFKRGVGMLGYGLATHIMLDVETPLYARAYVFYDPETKQRVALVNCELCMINPSLKDGVLETLRDWYPEWGYTDENLMLTAQHTHCAPSGYSYHPLYSMGSAGIVQEIYDKLVFGISEAIVQAEKAKVKGRVQLGKDTFDLELPVSFNRSIAAYNQNPEVEKPLSFADRHKAVDKEMTLLQFTDEHGLPIGSINWFAVHTTNLPNNFTRLCSDNKGYAAKWLEKSVREENKNFVASFAQGACGDVSARVKFNAKLDRQRGYWEGVFEDDLKSARHNGNIQYTKAKEIIQKIDRREDLSDGGLDALLLYSDFGNIDIDPAFTAGQEGCVTSPSCMGMAFLVGSVMDGPGMPEILGKGGELVAQLVRWKELAFTKGEARKALMRKIKAQGPKAIALETGGMRVLGSRPKNLLLPDFADELIRHIKHFDRMGLLQEAPWAPQVLPIQMLRIGKIAILGIPFEITTIASKRLVQTLRDKLQNTGIEHIILAPYANAYNGYIVTNEEYQIQMYEGGHCVFGQWSLNALQEKSAKVAEQLGRPKHQRVNLIENERHIFTKEFLHRFAHAETKFYARFRKKEASIALKNLRIEQRKNKRGASY